MNKTKLSLLLTMALSSHTFASSVNLDKITVTTPTKSTQSFQNTTANVDIITSAEIKERGFRTVSDALKTRPGIAFNRNGGLGKATAIMLRGFATKRVLVLVDGVRYNDPASISGANLQHILMENVERIEIVKGAQSGVWGADATSGVINIITKTANKEGLSASLNAEYGSYNTQTYGVNTAYKKDAFDISLSLQRLSTDGFTAKMPDGEKLSKFEDDKYENNSADIKLGYNITDKDRIETFFKYIDGENDYDGADANDTIATSDVKEQFYGLSYTRTLGENKTKIYANKSDFSRSFTAKNYKGEVATTKYDGSVNELGLNSAITYSKGGELSAGVDYKQFKHENKISKDYSNTGVFITNTNSFDALISGTTIFSQALRYDKFDDFDNKFTYKLGLKHIHENIKDFWTSVNYATAYNVPTLFQLYSAYGNPTLNPEETKSFDITANFKGLGITYFHNTIKDLIDYDSTIFKYGNLTGENKLSGLEASYANTLEVADLAYSLNYTYLKTEDKDGKELARRPKSTANVSLDYYGLTDTHIGALVQYVGTRKKSKYAKDQSDYNSYTLVDLTADYDVNTQLSVYGKIDNALDKKYQTITGYATSERAFYLGFRYKIQ